MKKTSLFIGSAVLAFMIPVVLFAASFRTGEQVNLSAQDAVSDDLYAAGGVVTVSGNIPGDIYAAGGTVSIDGSAVSDIVAAGGNVIISGSAGDDLRAAGGTVLLSGPVSGDLLAAGGNIRLSGPGIVGGAYIGGGSIVVEAPVGGAARIAGGNVTINAPVKGNVEVDADTLTLGSRAVIEGTLTYRSPNEMTKIEGAVVKGKITYKKVSKDAYGAEPFSAASLIIPFLMMLAASLAIGLSFKRFAAEITARAVVKTFLETARGLAVFILTPIVSIILLITVVGMPLGFLGLASTLFAVIFSMFLAPVLFGSILYKWAVKGEVFEVCWQSVFLGAAVFYLLGFIPVIGWFTQFVLVLMSAGSAVKVGSGIAAEWR